jgi:hypothetical protein
MMVTMSPHIVAHLCALADQLAGAADDPLSGLPRATREALAKIARERREKARVLLGPRLAARLDETKVDLVVEPRSASRASSRK